MDAFTKFQKFWDSQVERYILWAIPRSVRPNQVTALRITMSPLIFLSLYDGYSEIGLVLIVIAACSDFVDGAMARKRDQVTKLGKLLDPLADKLLIGSVLLYLSLTLDYLVLKVLFVAVMAELLAVFGGFFMSFYLNRPAHANFFGKTKMVLQSFGIAFLVFGLTADNKFFIDLSMDLLFVSIAFAIVSALRQTQARVMELRKK